MLGEGGLWEGAGAGRGGHRERGKEREGAGEAWVGGAPGWREWGGRGNGGPGRWGAAGDGAQVTSYGWKVAGDGEDWGGKG
ncbi:hypothetical protein TIFTF001_013170 [Ficus carica]|uniref:Uncharacterized protein n=1 Tax=Ficus carica TaxID=3494 RepID=A0AA88A1L2_FICCA|nr:hypothetical protein TIFTF001_013170 [Ficus carica]